LNSVVVGPSRVEICHSARIGRRLQEVGTAQKCPLHPECCSCNGRGPECHETQQG
jgi:hypothetical protein